MPKLPKFLGRFSVRKKILLSVSVLWLFGSAFLVLLANSQAEADLEAGIRTRVRDSVAVGVASLPGSAHARLQTAADQTSPDYEAVVLALRHILQNSTDLKYVYTVRQVADGSIIYVADATDPADEPALIGDPINRPTALLQEAIKGLKEPVIEEEFYTDEWGVFWTAYAPILTPEGKFDGLLCADIEASTVQKQLESHRNELFGLMLFTLLLLLPLGFVVSRTVVRPLREYVLATDRLAQGDYTQPLRPALAQRGDEIGDLARSFAILSENTRTLITAIQSQAQVLAEAGGQLKLQMNATTTSITQMTRNVGQIQGISHRQSATAHASGQRVGQIAVTIGQLVGHIERQSGSVTASSTAVEQMLASLASATGNLEKNALNVQSLQATSEQGRTDMTLVSEKIRQLSRESEGLLEVSEVIRDIASQTSLLSMNAAIEAAHAGASGRGFAVVADEIRKLAQSSATQAATVTGSLKTIQRSMEAVATATDQVLRQFQDIDAGVSRVSAQEQEIRQSITELNQGSQDIRQSLVVLKGVTGDVLAGSEQMLAESSAVIAESEGLETLTREVTQKVDGIALETSHVETAVQTVQTLSSQNEHSVAELLSGTKRFRVR